MPRINLRVCRGRGQHSRRGRCVTFNTHARVARGKENNSSRDDIDNKDISQGDPSVSKNEQQQNDPSDVNKRQDTSENPNLTGDAGSNEGGLNIKGKPDISLKPQLINPDTEEDNGDLDEDTEWYGDSSDDDKKEKQGN